MPKQGSDGRPSGSIKSVLSRLDAESDDAANVVALAELKQGSAARRETARAPRSLQAGVRDTEPMTGPRERAGLALPLAVAASMLAILLPLAWIVIDPGASPQVAPARPGPARASDEPGAGGPADNRASFAARSVAVEIVGVPAEPRETSPRLVAGPTPTARPIEAMVAPPERGIESELSALAPPGRVAAPDTIARVVPVERIEAMFTRGVALANDGDIAGARLMLERAADGGHPRAALALAETYDARRLAERRVLGIGGDVDRARFWYERARALGNADAERRLQDLPR